MKTDNKKRKADVLLIIAVLLLIAGVVLLLIDPIKEHNRNKVTEEAISVIESQIMNEEAVITFVVDSSANEINGEEYDYFGEEVDFESWQNEIDEAQSTLPQYVTLTCLGMIDVKSVDIHIPIWDEATTVSLRYGAGHFENSVMFGENGNCTLLAHHMRTYGSMFNRLNEVEIGDSIKITVPGNHEYIYYVDEIKIISAEELEANIVGNITDTKQITLVTCTYTDQGKMRLLVIGHMASEET